MDGQGGTHSTGGLACFSHPGVPMALCRGSQAPIRAAPMGAKKQGSPLAVPGPLGGKCGGGCWHPGRRGGGFTCGSVEWAASFAPPLILLTGRNGLGAVAAGFRGAGPHQVDATR